MCGIVGFSGDSSCAKVLKECLGKLEYRGYDSFGVATYENESFFCEKEVHLKSSISEISWEISLKNLPGKTGIAHCRWATHGSLSEENTHPHIDFSRRVYMVHNGIVENHTKLKVLLQKKGIKFYSQSDSEVLINWISSYTKVVINKDLLIKSIKESLSFVEGKYAIALMFLDHPNMIFATKNGTPLVVGKTTIGSFVSSDISALLIHNPQIVSLEDGQIVCINDKDISVFSQDNSLIKNDDLLWEIPNYEKDSHKKGIYPFFMIKEIEEQVTILDQIYEVFCKYNNLYLEHIFGILKNKILQPNIKFLFLGCGSSWHAGLFAKYCFEELCTIKTDVEYASEFRYRNPIIDSSETIAFIVSQSGETTDSISAMEKVFSLGVPCVGIVNRPYSEIARKSTVCILINAGTEWGIAATKSFSAQLLLIYLTAIETGRLKNVITESTHKNFIDEISEISSHVLEIIRLRPFIKDCIYKFFTKKNIALYLGRGSSMCIALEGALKLKEVSYVHAHGYPAAEIKHGPIALVETDMPVIVLVPPNQPEQSKVLSNISEVRSRGAKVIAVCSKIDVTKIKDLCDVVIPTPECKSPMYFSILSNIVLQIIAYETALLKEINPDRPRNLAKSITVE